MSKTPVAIIILDGFGWRNEMMGNAVKLAKKPNFDRYWNNLLLDCLKVKWVIPK